MNGMDTTNSVPLLSICIPTWNRRQFLDLSLRSLKEQLKDIDQSKLELFVSDNCSDDGTDRLVRDYINQGLPINYFRQSENVGASKNFINCMRNCTGKYILLLGDDDILKPRALKRLIDSLEGKDYGLVFIYDQFNSSTKEFNNSEKFLKYVSFWITFMSGNVFRKEIVHQIQFDKYIGTHLIQVPFYITSALSSSCNLVLGENIIEGSLDKSNNGGFNFYEVFVRNYLNIYKEFVDKKMVSKSTFNWLQRDVYWKYIIPYSFKFLFLKKNIKKEDGILGHRKGYKIEGYKAIMREYYGSKIYARFAIMGYLKSFAGYIYHKYIK